MSDRPLAKKKLKRAVPLGPGDRSSIRLPPLPELDTAVRGNGDTKILKKGELLPIFIRVEDPLPIRGWGQHGQGLAAMLRWAVREAPAWLVSMVVHTVTLVAMAMAAVPGPTNYRPQQRLVVVPPEEKPKIEEVAEAPSTLPPNTLEEDTPADPAAAAESKLDQEKQEKQEKAPFDPSEELAVAEKSHGTGRTSGTAGPAGAEASGDIGLPPGPLKDLLLSEKDGSGYPSGRVGKNGANPGGGSDGGGGGPAGTGAYKLRKTVAGNAKKVAKEGGDAVSEKCVTHALRWLANHQMPDGGWSFAHGLATGCHGACRDPGKLAEARMAATALAVLPFLGSNNTHKESKAGYKSTVYKGLYFLINHMRVGPDGGDLSDPEPAGMYSHGLATIALCEAYGMTHDKNFLLKPTQQALMFICSAQDPKGGGWRYLPRMPGDTSVAGWQLMALKSGLMAGIDIANIEVTAYKAGLFLDSVQVEGGAKYGYLTPGQGDATTAIGLLCRMYSGWKKDNPILQRGVQLLSRRGPSPGNMYYNYYATQVMHHWQGDEWQNWNRQMRDQLTHAQAKQGHEDGSWFTGSGDLGARPAAASTARAWPR